MPTNEQIDAALAVAAREAKWSINQIGTVRQMLEAAERAAPDVCPRCGINHKRAEQAADF